MNPNEPREALERAVKRLGSANAVADHLGVSKSHMSALRSGKRDVTPEQFGILIDDEGGDGKAAAHRLLAERAGTARGRLFWSRAAAAVVMVMTLLPITLSRAVDVSHSVPLSDMLRRRLHHLFRGAMRGISPHKTAVIRA